MELVRLIKTTKKPPPSRSIHGKKTERSLSQTIIRHNIEKRISHLLEDLYKKGKLRVVTLQKSPVYGYGMKLLTIDGIYTKVGSITPNSPADLSKQIFEGDILIANNGKNLVDIGASNVVASLSEKNSATLLLIPEDEHIFSFRGRRRFKKQLNELQTHFGQ